MPISFEVESEREVPVSVNRGVPLALANPRSSMVKSLGDIADKLVPVSKAQNGTSKGGEEKKSRRRLGR
jgi:MinD-like ATPase involved in chromosome partitioning or flagellar assembly